MKRRKRREPRSSHRAPSRALVEETLARLPRGEGRELRVRLVVFPAGTFADTDVYANAQPWRLRGDGSWHRCGPGARIAPAELEAVAAALVEAHARLASIGAPPGGVGKTSEAAPPPEAPPLRQIATDDTGAPIRGSE